MGSEFCAAGDLRYLPAFASGGRTERNMIVRNRKKTDLSGGKAQKSVRGYGRAEDTPALTEQPEQGRGYGLLRVQAFTARRALPVRGAAVTVVKNTAGVPEVLYSAVTDSAGMTPVMVLAGIPQSAAMSPNDGFADIAKQYSYDIFVMHPDFVPMHFINVPVFEGVTSVQNADMIPGNPGAEPERMITVNERTNNL